MYRIIIFKLRLSWDRFISINVSASKTTSLYQNDPQIVTLSVWAFLKSTLNRFVTSDDKAPRCVEVSLQQDSI